MEAANSSEFDPEGPHSVIDLMPDQQGQLPKGGTMRLGAYPCRVQPGQPVGGRLRLRGGVGEASPPLRVQQRLPAGHVPGGHGVFRTSPDGRLVEALELKDHPFFVGVQFHPEFKSRPNRAQPLFRAFIRAALQQKEDRT